MSNLKRRHFLIASVTPYSLTKSHHIVTVLSKDNGVGGRVNEVESGISTSASSEEVVA